LDSDGDGKVGVGEGAKGAATLVGAAVMAKLGLKGAFSLYGKVKKPVGLALANPKVSKALTVANVISLGATAIPESKAEEEPKAPAETNVDENAAQAKHEKIVNEATKQPDNTEAPPAAKDGDVVESGKADKVAVAKGDFDKMLGAAGYKDGEQLKNRLSTAKDEDLSEKEDGKIEISAKTQKWLADASAAREHNKEAQHLLKELGYELKFGEDGKAYDGGETLTALEKAKAEYKIEAKSTVIDFDAKDSSANEVSNEMLNGLKQAVAEKKSKAK